MPRTASGPQRNASLSRVHQKHGGVNTIVSNWKYCTASTCMHTQVLQTVSRTHRVFELKENKNTHLCSLQVRLFLKGRSEEVIYLAYKAHRGNSVT